MGTGGDLWFTKRKPDGGFELAQPFLQSPFNEQFAAFSPDGRFVVYDSNEAGLDEIYVRSFPDGGSKWQISVNGGNRPLWSRDGKEIFYLHGASLTAVPVVKQGAYTFGSPVELFKTVLATTSLNVLDVSPDGKRFLIIEPIEDPNAKPPAIHVVQNWTHLLRQ